MMIHKHNSYADPIAQLFFKVDQTQKPKTDIIFRTHDSLTTQVTDKLMQDPSNDNKPTQLIDNMYVVQDVSNQTWLVFESEIKFEGMNGAQYAKDGIKQGWVTSVYDGKVFTDDRSAHNIAVEQRIHDYVKLVLSCQTAGEHKFDLMNVAKDSPQPANLRMAPYPVRLPDTGATAVVLEHVASITNRPTNVTKSSNKCKATMDKILG